MAESMMLHHASYQIIREPDVRYGRKNADFGQGFYLSAAGDFAGRWVRERRGEQVYVNRYALELSGLTAHRFERDGPGLTISLPTAGARLAIFSSWVYTVPNKTGE